MQNEVEFDMMINYQNAKMSWIKLKGKLNLEQATLYGDNFTVSQDLIESMVIDLNAP